MPKFQSYWEFATVALALLTWAGRHRAHALAVLSDNTSALQDALHLKGNKQMLPIARELAWRRARFGWRYEVGHLPSEHNVLADALSRLFAPDASTIPSELRAAREIAPAQLKDLWRLE